MNRLGLLGVVLVGGISAAQVPLPVDESPVPPPASLGVTRGVERFEDPGYAVPGFHVVSQSRRSLWIPGFIAFGAGYLFSLTFLPVLTDSLVAIPIAGSFIAGGRLLDSRPSGAFPVMGYLGGAVLMVAGAAQVVGVVLAVAGFALPRVWLERDSQVSVSLGPGGVALSGQF